MPMVLEMHPELCTGCAQCVLACGWVQSGSFDPLASLVRVQSYGAQLRFAPYTCFQCDEAWCMTACPTHAITTDEETGCKVVIEEACVGCALCVIACPYGTMFLQPRTGIASKCDLCHGRPACAGVCPTDAIVVLEDGKTTDRIGPWAKAHQERFIQSYERCGDRGSA